MKSLGIVAMLSCRPVGNSKELKHLINSIQFFLQLSDLEIKDSGSRVCVGISRCGI